MTIKADMTKDELLEKLNQGLWSADIERQVLATIKAALPGIEYGRLERSTDVRPHGPAYYARLQNGPDLYLLVDAETSLSASKQHVLRRVLGTWTNIPTKRKDAAPRTPLDCEAFVATLDQKLEEQTSLWHAVEGLHHGAACDERFFRMQREQPEHFHDLQQHYTRWRRGER